MKRAFTAAEKERNAAILAGLRAIWPKGTLVTLAYDGCEPAPVEGHKMTRYNGPQVKLEGRWYYLGVIQGGKDVFDALMPSTRLPVTQGEVLCIGAADKKLTTQR